MRWTALLCAPALLAGCPVDEKPRGSGTFKDLRAHLGSHSLPLAAQWQATEARVTALTAAGQAARAAAAVADAQAVLRSWSEALQDTPAPLPIKAPLATLRKALDGLAAGHAPGPEREKALDQLEGAVQDLARRKVQVAPSIQEPLTDADYLTRIWRDVQGLESLGRSPRPLGPPGSAPEAADPLASLLAAAREAQASAGSPAERLAHGYGLQLLATAEAYRKNPPKIDQRTAMAFRLGRIGREQIDAAICAAAKPLAARVRAVEKLALQVNDACARPGACAQAAADLAWHPMLRELKAVGAKAVECERPPPAPEGAAAPVAP